MAAGSRYLSRLWLLLFLCPTSVSATEQAGDADTAISTFLNNNKEQEVFEDTGDEETVSHFLAPEPSQETQQKDNNPTETQKAKTEVKETKKEQKKTKERQEQEGPQEGASVNKGVFIYIVLGVLIVLVGVGLYCLKKL